MSLNLCFFHKTKIISFPFQTPTELTFKVLSCKTKEEKLSLLKDQL